MILRDLVGGGGSVKSSFEIFFALDGRRLDAWSPAVISGETGETGWKEEPEPDTLEIEEVSLPAPIMAGGGRENDVSREGLLGLSWAMMSVEDAGVGGRPGRGIVSGGLVHTNEVEE